MATFIIVLAENSTSKIHRNNRLNSGITSSFLIYYYQVLHFLQWKLERMKGLFLATLANKSGHWIRFQGKQRKRFAVCYDNLNDQNRARFVFYFQIRLT